MKAATPMTSTLLTRRSLAAVAAAAMALGGLGLAHAQSQRVIHILSLIHI